MISSKEFINNVNKLTLAERLTIVEEILRSIRAESSTNEDGNKPNKKIKTLPLLNLSGIISDDEASSYYEAISESRKVDANEW